jgi:hypothetical protein
MPRFRRVERLAVLAVAVGLAAMSAAARDFAAVKAESVRPAMSKSGAGGELQVSFFARGRDYRLRLAENPRLASWAADSRWVPYAGELENVPGSWVRVSIAGNSLSGAIFDGQELLVVEPGDGGEVRVFRLADARLEPGVSFAGDIVEVPTVGRISGAIPAAPRVEGISAERRLEISALGDAAFRARYESDQAARDALLARLNIVDGIFSAQVGIAIAVTSINIADTLSDSLGDSIDPPLLLDSLGRLRQQTPALNSRGLTHLFTGRDLDGGSVGIAYTESLCNARYSASLAQAHNNATLDGLISAHEMGHVFGAPHDGAGVCAETSPTQFIMAPTLSSQVTSFSQCSLAQIAPRVANASCLAPLLPPDLALPALGSHQVAAGVDFDWRIDLQNQGEQAANGARVTVQVTPAITMVSATAAGGGCVLQASRAICDLAVVNAGESVQMHFVMRSQTPGTFSAEAEVVAADDANRGNDSGQGTLLVGGAPAPTPEPPPPASAGRSGGGALDGALLGLLGVLLAAGTCRRRSCLRGAAATRAARCIDAQRDR